MGLVLISTLTYILSLTLKPNLLLLLILRYLTLCYTNYLLSCLLAHDTVYIIINLASVRPSDPKTLYHGRFDHAY